MVRVAVFPSLLLRHRLAENQDILLVGIPEEGGCFPGEYQCTTNGCIPMAGVSGIGTCSTNRIPSLPSIAQLRVLTTILKAPDPTETVLVAGVVGKITPSQTPTAKVVASANDHPTPHHTRNWSDASSISEISSSALTFAELDSQADGERKLLITSAFSRAPIALVMGSMMKKKKSNSILASPASIGPGLGSPRSPHGMSSPKEGLPNIPEAGECRIGLEGEGGGEGGGVGVGRVGVGVGLTDGHFRDVPLIGGQSKFGDKSTRGRIRMGKLWGMERSG
ncbi:uncharacterized protein RAG0_05167 [Rhynchosporium agropyri]|uniref:Uncharacterized protein n=1 Tax=Rhynchosporium agropyri TaxID=914238 RepID=A0A1E1KC88_9HELO|nr:uncharacterized protein RAG0_05167 [Rhynchosporium agropyri]